MDYNTVPNSGFTYPDFSQVSANVPTNQNTPSTSVSSTPIPATDEDKMLEDLANQLKGLQEEAQNIQSVQPNPNINTTIQTPISENIAKPTLPQAVNQEPLISVSNMAQISETPAQQPLNQIPSILVDPIANNTAVNNTELPITQNSPAQEPTSSTYNVQPTPLPKIKEKDVTSNFVLPEAPAPLPSNVVTKDTIGVVKSSLEDIMPSEPKPKALQRNPIENNLSKPVDVPTEDKSDYIRPVSEVLKKENSSSFVDIDKNKNDIIDTAKSMDINDLLKYAIDNNASDLHISVGYPPIVRIDGDLREVNDRIISPQDAEDLIFPILSDDKKELLEVNREIDLAYFYQAEVSARFRVNAFYSMKNLSAAFRLIPSRVRTLDELMLPQLYTQFARLKQGLVLVTGPTGHGKSTTLAAIIEEVNRTRLAHVVTIEDPIEYVFEGKKALIDQREMNDDTHSWTIALRSALRQDPDVILVGEMRDYETIAAAITLAETGHLVFATLHTNSASQTLERIIDVFPENQQPQIRSQLSNILEAVVAQRLIPLDKGGRRAVSEIMIANPAVRNLIREGKTSQIDNVIRTSADIGMISLEKSLVNLVREGAISVQRAQEYAVFPEEVLRLLKS